jgi:hypothetical protein
MLLVLLPPLLLPFTDELPLVEVGVEAGLVGLLSGDASMCKSVRVIVQEEE